VRALEAYLLSVNIGKFCCDGPLIPSHDVIVLSKPSSFAEDASKETLVLAEDLAEQFLGEKLR